MFRKQPILGGSVRITGNGRELVTKTNASGEARVNNLQPGTYWLKADVLGTYVGYECFHINSVPSRKAVRERRFEWGNDAPAVKSMAGQFIDMQPAKTDKPLWNLLHHIEVPIANVQVTFADPVAGMSYSTATDSTGHFSIVVPDGIYAMHAEGGNAAERTYDGADLVIRVSSQARAQSLRLQQREASGGSCGGTSLELRDEPAN